MLGTRFVLNAGDPGPGPDEPGAAAEALQRALLGALAAHTGAHGRVDYPRLRASAEFAAAAAAARALAGLDLGRLATRADRLAFWINGYNALVLHAVIALRVRRSVREVWNFFGRVSYRVGGHVLSVDDIEHGILRGNRRRIFPPCRPFRARDARRPLAVEPLDPRIHFAITCGARSCPPVGVYRADRVEAQLDLAARSFLGQEVTLDARGRVGCSRLLKWYRADFEAAGGLGPFLLRHLDPGPVRTALEGGAVPCRVFHPYSWALQHAPA